MKLLLLLALTIAVAGADSLPALTPYAPIAAMVDSVDAGRLTSSVSRLVGFGTRNDFSERASTRVRSTS